MGEQNLTDLGAPLVGPVLLGCLSSQEPFFACSTSDPALLSSCGQMQPQLHFLHCPAFFASVNDVYVPHFVILFPVILTWEDLATLKPELSEYQAHLNFIESKAC